MDLKSINSKSAASFLSVKEPETNPILTRLEVAQKNVDKNRSIYLTFDDGPDSIYTPTILNLLDEHNVKATFFVLGEAAKKFPHLIQRMMKAGHTVGNHTYSHRHPWTLLPDQAKQEVARATTVIKDITGRQPLWFRPPFGRIRKAMIEQAQLEEMTTVLWSHSIIDWGILGTEIGISKRLERIKAGDIVLMHDGKRQHNQPEIIIQCLPKFLSSLPDKKLIAVPLDDVLSR